MRKELCLCAEIALCRQSLKTKTRVIILMHHREQPRTTNTARLAHLLLSDCEIRIRGLQDTPMDVTGIRDEERQPLLLFPSGHARVLTPEYVSTFQKPVTLIVPDGTWKQAGRVTRRESVLSSIPNVTLPEGRPSQYGLRRSPNANALATFEAIARALGILESAAVQEQLESMFTLMVTRTLNSRGIRKPDGTPDPDQAFFDESDEVSGKPY